jgi:hypothetical protein
MPEESLETGELKESLDQGVERAEHKGKRRARGEEHEGGGPRWTNFLSLQTAIIAVFAAVASLESGGNSNDAILSKNEAILYQSQASDQWAYYQAKGVKQTLAANQAVSGSPSLAAKFEAQAARYQAEQGEIQSAARALEAKVEAANQHAEQLLERHHRFAISVTLFQIAIALSAIAALTKRKTLWTVGLTASVVGLILFVRGFTGP